MYSDLNIWSPPPFFQIWIYQVSIVKFGNKDIRFENYYYGDQVEKGEAVYFEVFLYM
jgi:hypothetical protein